MEPWMWFLILFAVWMFGSFLILVVWNLLADLYHRRGRREVHWPRR